MKSYAIILASGLGERSGLSVPKQFVKIAGKSVLEHTLTAFQNALCIDEVIVVTNDEYRALVNELVLKNSFTKVSKVVRGGQTRRESSYLGLSAIEEEDAKVLIHDAVRPFVSSKIINDCITALDKYSAVDVAIPSADTIIEVNSDNVIKNIPPRRFYMRGQTPQAFSLKVIRMAHELANKVDDLQVTDDCSLVLKFNLADVYVVAGDDANIKITYPIDIDIADKLFQLKTSDVQPDSMASLSGKVVVILGGHGGIGGAIAKLAEENGAKVYSLSRKDGVDISDENCLKKIFETIYTKEKKIDYVINAAGLLKFGALCDRDSADIKEEVETNYIGCINIAKAAFEYLKESRGGLLFYSSSSYTRGRKMYSIYSSTKAAVVNLTQALAEEWEEDSVRVNVIVPERTATPMRYENFGDEPKDTLLSPEFVAKLSLAAILSNMSGQIINVKKIQENC